jgi:hypothetical protein
MYTNMMAPMMMPIKMAQQMMAPHAMMMGQPAPMPMMQQQQLPAMQDQEMMAPMVQLQHSYDAATAAGKVEWTNVTADANGRSAITTAATVCRIRDGIAHGEELLTVRDGRTYRLNNSLHVVQNLPCPTPTPSISLVPPGFVEGQKAYSTYHQQCNSTNTVRTPTCDKY